jgi:hypothetical protein
MSDVNDIRTTSSGHLGCVTHLKYIARKLNYTVVQTKVLLNAKFLFSPQYRPEFDTNVAV